MWLGVQTARDLKGRIKTLLMSCAGDRSDARGRTGTGQASPRLDLKVVRESAGDMT